MRPNVGFSAKNLSKPQVAKKMTKTGKNGFPMKNSFFHPRGQKGLSTHLCGQRPNFLGQKHFKMMPGSVFGIFGILGQKKFLTQFLPF